MIAIDQLRYVRLATRDLAAAVDFAERVLGLQLVDRTHQAAYFRSDFRDHTLVFFIGESAENTVGFEVRSRAHLDETIAELSQHGIEVVVGSEQDCSARKVRAFASFRDPGGNTIDLVLRPLQSGWRYFPGRDAGVVGLTGVVLRSRDVLACERSWTTLFNGRVSDWIGDAVFLRFDRAHHRLAYYPSTGKGTLAIEFGVENVDLLMQNSYFLRSAQVRIVHGPGRRPTSNQMFVTFVGPDETLFSFVTEGDDIADEATHRPRQFPRSRSSFCTWGSESDLPEFC
ncbi:oxidoreductase [Bradyrhizobium sp. LTSPM299]|jgi:2,3-dihydroxy-p-cumate/2,3-dihydroxybenzoate 3,4-dioxygenase|uniref:VOC family protein n=1 Tax=Bradyrhizobium sp. LTSPM299 TaxID=1619233 RepID=UPI0005CA57C3|nr:VOC family protein [Bradyrhizobium sp. LTSPM299]KJC62108.1 oxidoreductase [Bradyrhizobium sp. LTSPM299]